MRPAVFAAAATLALGATGCFSGSVLTTARTLPPGAQEHVAAVDMPVAFVSDYRRDRRGLLPDEDRRLESPGYPQPTYAIRLGALPGVEVGGRVATTSLEVSGKVQMVARRRFALAIAPRVTSGGDTDTGVQLHARLPLLATLDFAGGWSLTPRVGVGATTGDPDPRDWDRGRSRATRTPFAEGGVTVMVPVRGRMRVAVEPYVFRVVGEEGVTGGLAMGLVFGAGR